MPLGAPKTPEATPAKEIPEEDEETRNLRGIKLSMYENKGNFSWQLVSVKNY
jgi:hypothetical protein